MSEPILLCFDGVLLLALLFLAWQLLTSPDIFKAVVLFIAFGLVMALAWVRLRAPDMALAEAALGAGITGPLFLSALRRMERSRKGERRLNRQENRQEKQKSHKKSPFKKPFYLIFLLLAAGLTLLLARIILIIDPTLTGLRQEVHQVLAMSGVKSPVTAVLLNFRGYDTLLEVMVLLVAVIGVWALNEAPFSRQKININPVQLGVVRLLAPLMCLVAAALVWQGSHLAGGAFQGGAVFGATGVLLLVTELPWIRNVPSRLLRAGLLLGPLVFLTIAISCMVTGDALLHYPPAMAASLLLIIEIACAISIGLTLASLFAGGRPETPEPVT